MQRHQAMSGSVMHTGRCPKTIHHRSYRKARERGRQDTNTSRHRGSGVYLMFGMHHPADISLTMAA